MVDFVAHYIGADRVMMGSDYCFPIVYERLVDIVTANRYLNSDPQSAILEGNPPYSIK